MEYDVVVATKDRAEALWLSIPRILGQRQPPNKLIVVDSSSDKGLVRQVVDALVNTPGVEIEIVECKPGLPTQRNVGLVNVSAPVVMFPDDDSIWYPNTAEAIMRIYERDAEGKIAAVCTAESRTPPADFMADRSAVYDMTAAHRMKQRVGHARARFERWAFPDPFVLHGRSMWAGRSDLDWFAEENVVQVEWMTGFRMSFRTEVVREFGFDENFGGYALFEDTDASFSAMRKGLVVGARNTEVYHHRMPGGRGSERKLGATQILNRAYVICKHSAPGSEARERLVLYGRYKLAQYLSQVHSGHGRERVRGALAAQRRVGRLLEASPEELPLVYQKALSECLNGE